MELNYQHWFCEKDENDILWAYLDRKDEKVNSLSEPVLTELNQLISLASQRNYKGMIVTSKKTTGFVAGADISQISKTDSLEAGLEFIEFGQKVFANLEDLIIPTVALISGFCLGGGCELALACDYRIVEDIPATRMGLPEVLLGVHPGWGGMIRLPRLIGPLQALNLILTGRTVDARRAVKLGMADALVPKRQMKRAAVNFILNKPKKHNAGLMAKLLNTFPMRFLLARVMARQVAKKANKKHYPAPFAAIKQWRDYGVSGQRAYKAEAKSIANMFMTPTSKQLVRLFFLQTRMKSLPQEKTFDIKHVHVIGAGTMGGDIAAWCALKGFRVTLQDREPQFIAPAIGRAAKLFKIKLKAAHLVQEALDRLLPDTQGHGVKDADVIIEAVFEDLKVKQDIFTDLERKAKPEAILATNTSSIPLDEINTVMDNPGRLVGIHFFNPVAKMQLVEIVHGEKTTDSTVQKATRLVSKLGKLPLPVLSKPGFLVNRVLLPYLMESVVLLEEGNSKEAIDKAATDFGMPMGPIELADTVGLDVCLAVATELMNHFGGKIPQVLQGKVDAKRLGRKTKHGFYEYKKAKAVKSKKNTSYSQDLQERLINRMLDEAKACLDEGVVEDKDLLDAGMIFGTGFAPFRGGPMQYLASK